MIELRITGDSWAEVWTQVSSLAVPRIAPLSEDEAEEVRATSAPGDLAPEPKKAPKRGGRVYGSPGSGRGRRSKEEIAEDKELDELAAALGREVPTDVPVAEVLLAWRQESNEPPAPEPAAEPEPAIWATPEAREPAEEAVEAEVVVTLDDVRKALGEVLAHMQAEHGPKAMTETQEWLFKGTGKRKMSELTPDQYAAVVEAAAELTGGA